MSSHAWHYRFVIDVVVFTGRMMQTVGR
jgi:hypothetical protein